MATFNWPTATWAKPGSYMWRVIDNLQRASESPLSGAIQTLAMPGARWGLSLHFAHQALADRDQLEGFLLSLYGRENRVRMYDFNRQRPRGTINLTGVTTSGSTAQFARQMTLQGCGAGKTLLSGDWFATPTQLLRCTEDATADGAGQMVVKFAQMLRAATAGGAAITLDKPTALYVRTEASLAAPRSPAMAALPMDVDFVEVFS